jgi:hypothetical protein
MGFSPCGSFPSPSTLKLEIVPDPNPFTAEKVPDTFNYSFNYFAQPLWHSVCAETFVTNGEIILAAHGGRCFYDTL